MAKQQRVTNVTIHTRAEIGTTGAKKARREGRIPGALYGHGDAQAIAVDAKTLNELLTSGGQSHIVEAMIGGKKESVLLREVQRDPITHRPIAADFQRVSSTEAIYASVPIVTVGVAPGVKEGGGVMDVVTHALEVRGPAGSLPEHFELDVSALNVGERAVRGGEDGHCVHGPPGRARRVRAGRFGPGGAPAGGGVGATVPARLVRPGGRRRWCLPGPTIVHRPGGPE